MSAFKRYRAHLQQRMFSAVNAACTQTAACARENAPVRTGRLRGSIACSVQATSQGAAGEVTVSAPHASAVELGTSRHAAQPFLRPAFKSAKRLLTDSLK